jgi:hypothetical protein
MSGIMKTMSNLSEAANEALVEYNKEVRNIRVVLAVIVCLAVCGVFF